MSAALLQRALDVLLIEDQSADVHLVEEALLRSGARHVLHVIPDGADALEYLDGQGRYASVPKPDLILLDLGLPRASGFEVLRRIKEDEMLRTIPVIVLTVYAEEDAVWRSYQQYANAYVVKPAEPAVFTRTVEGLVRFYLRTASLPPKDAADRHR